MLNGSLPWPLLSSFMFRKQKMQLNFELMGLFYSLFTQDCVLSQEPLSVLQRRRHLISAWEGRWLLFSSLPGQKHKCLRHSYGRSLHSGDSSKQARQSLSLFLFLPFVKHKIKPFLTSCCNAGAVKLVFTCSTVLKEQERIAVP